MKNILMVSLCAAWLISTAVPAQETVRTIVTVGGSYWNASYTAQDEDGEDLYDYGTGNLFGPYLSLNRGKWNLGASLYFGKIPVEETNYDDMKRTDLNFTVGYRVHPNINLFAGLKYLTWTQEGSFDWYNQYGYLVDNYEYEETFKAPLFGAGIGGTLPLGTSGLYAFGSVSYLMGSTAYHVAINSTETDESLEEDSEGDLECGLFTLNLGLGYRFASGMGINLGYRGDVIEQSGDIETSLYEWEVDNQLGVKGLVVTISYTFK